MKVSAREKNYIYVCITVAVIIAAYMFIIEPFIISKEKINSDIGAKLNMIYQYEKVLKSTKEQSDKLNTFEKRTNALKEKLLTGTTPQVAAAELQKILQGMTNKSGLSVNSIKVSNTKEFEHFVQIPVEINIKSRIRPLKDLMFSIENNKKFLTVSKMVSKIIDIKNPLVIETRLEVSGFMGRKI